MAFFSLMLVEIRNDEKGRISVCKGIHCPLAQSTDTFTHFLSPWYYYRCWVFRFWCTVFLYISCVLQICLFLIGPSLLRISRAIAPPVPTAEDYQRAMQQDVTAPPTAGGLFPTGGFSPGPSSSRSSSPSDTVPPSDLLFPTDSHDGTTFRTEGSSSGNSESSKGGWFSFGSS